MRVADATGPASHTLRGGLPLRSDPTDSIGPCSPCAVLVRFRRFHG